VFETLYVTDYCEGLMRMDGDRLEKVPTPGLTDFSHLDNRVAVLLPYAAGPGRS